MTFDEEDDTSVRKSVKLKPELLFTRPATQLHTTTEIGLVSMAGCSMTGRGPDDEKSIGLITEPAETSTAAKFKCPIWH